MDNYEGYLERKERAELTLSERFDDWIRGRNNPSSDAADIAYIDLLNMKVDGSIDPSFSERITESIGRLYSLRPTRSWSEDYYEAVSENTVPSIRGRLYGVFRYTVEALSWVPDRLSGFANAIYNKVSTLIFEWKLRRNEGEE